MARWPGWAKALCIASSWRMEAFIAFQISAANQHDKTWHPWPPIKKHTSTSENVMSLDVDMMVSGNMEKSWSSSYNSTCHPAWLWTPQSLHWSAAHKILCDDPPIACGLQKRMVVNFWDLFPIFLIFHHFAPPFTSNKAVSHLTCCMAALSMANCWAVSVAQRRRSDAWAMASVEFGFHGIVQLGGRKATRTTWTLQATLGWWKKMPYHEENCLFAVWV